MVLSREVGRGGSEGRVSGSSGICPSKRNNMAICILGTETNFGAPALCQVYCLSYTYDLTMIIYICYIKLSTLWAHCYSNSGTNI